MDKTFYTGSYFDKCSVVSHNNYLAMNLVTYLEVFIQSIPWVRSELLETELDTFLLVIEVDDNNLDLLVEFNDIVWVIDTSP